MIPTQATADIFLPVQAELQAVEAKLRQAALGNQHPALTSALEHLLASGGKRVRPAMALLTGRLFDADRQRTVALAAAIEMLHTATLVHDDLIDGSLLRRGLPTLNAQWTPGATVLTGDFLFARAAELATETESVRVIKEFSRTLMIIVNGEINQMFVGRGEASREGYVQRIFAKTASLFAVAAEAAAVLGGADERTITAMRSFGREVGMAFQIVDDVLDFTADATRLGKPVGSDLRQGLFTLPVLRYLERHPDDADLADLLNGHPNDAKRVERAVEAVRGSGAIADALDEAKAYVGRAQGALAPLPGSDCRRALYDLADYIVSRTT
ncbi:MAG: polyprenyl synthetase family protein [Anaerolineales bacterium]|nr:polyprenyl synthetase family protein [Anaerolineales bacterium]